MNRGFDFSFVTGDPDADQRAFQRALETRMACAHRAPEPAVVASLFAEAWLSPAQLQQARTLAATLARAVRAQRTTASGIDALMAEFSLDSAEGVALMCLAEALLRIPDDATRDALIRDKLATGDWQSHIGASPSLFVNAAAWGMLATGKLMAPRSLRPSRAGARRAIIALLIGALVLASTPGCVTDPYTGEQRVAKTAIGGVLGEGIGAGVAAGIAALAGKDAAKAAMIGGGVGALGGAAVGA